MRLLLNKRLHKQLKSTHLETGRVKKSPGRGFLAIITLNHPHELTVLKDSKSLSGGLLTKLLKKTAIEWGLQQLKRIACPPAEQWPSISSRGMSQLPFPRDRRDGSVQGTIPAHELGFNASGLKFCDSPGCSRWTPVLWYAVCEPRRMIQINETKS